MLCSGRVNNFNYHLLDRSSKAKESAFGKGEAKRKRNYRSTRWFIATLDLLTDVDDFSRWNIRWTLIRKDYLKIKKYTKDKNTAWLSSNTAQCLLFPPIVPTIQLKEINIKQNKNNSKSVLYFSFQWECRWKFQMRATLVDTLLIGYSLVQLEGDTFSPGWVSFVPSS